LEKQVNRLIRYFFLLGLIWSNSLAFGQEKIDVPIVVKETSLIYFDYMNPESFVLKGLSFTGVKNFDVEVLKMLTGLNIGDTLLVPGESITTAVQKLWKQSLFQDIAVKASKIQGDEIWLEIILEERPRLSKFSFKGIKRGDIDNLKDKIGLVRGKVVTANLKLQIVNIIKAHYIEKGYYKVQTNIEETVDKDLKNGVALKIDIKKGPKIKIANISFVGNESVTDKKLKRLLKNTKEKRWYSLFKSSKYIKNEFEEDKQGLMSYYYNQGNRDIVINTDTLFLNTDSLLELKLVIEEGRKYYFGDITWSGNIKYRDSLLSAVLGIYKGEVFDQSALERQLYANQNGQDISSIYMDNGYLFFQVNPIERKIYNDTIDIEIAIYEGPQAIVSNIIISGNTKTNEHVIRRELRTLPGDKFSRSDVIRSQREIANLGYFNPENMNVTPIPHPENGTVDIEYKVEEKPSDQVELSAGWGQNTVVGTLGLSFNNFSVKNIFKKGAWSPLPSGDGQRLSIRAQSTGQWFRSLSASFTEPWLGGKKPNSMTTAVYTSLQSGGTNENVMKMQTTGASVNFGFRLKVPDDFFIFQTGVEFQRFDLLNWTGFGSFLFPTGKANNLNLQATLMRNSVDNPLYPRDGSKISLSLKVTPPYSLFSPDKDYANMTAEEKYEWIEYHKWKFDAEWYSSIVGDLVLKARASFGFLGLYSTNLGYSPFERFDVGGDGITNFQIYGKEIVALRGYENSDVMGALSGGAPFFDKFTLELRYPLSLNPMSTIYTLAFLEGGNVWNDFSKYNPFDIKRTAGLGVRIFLPMFGVLGFDYGIGFDKYTSPGSSLFDKGKFSILLGFEPY
jgi:outer membrane protein insertion porin family